jgi:hypothetical protein
MYDSNGSQIKVKATSTISIQANKTIKLKSSEDNKMKKTSVPTAEKLVNDFIEMKGDEELALRPLDLSEEFIEFVNTNTDTIIDTLLDEMLDILQTKIKK